MELIYYGRSKRRLDKKSLLTLIREYGISEQEFLAWLDIPIDNFATLNRHLRYETFKAQIGDYLQAGRLQPNEIRGGFRKKCQETAVRLCTRTFPHTG